MTLPAETERLLSPAASCQLRSLRMKTTLYGFKACDTVQKARKWLDAKKVEHRFFDYRVETLDPKTVDEWFKRAGWESVFNRGSASFKELTESDRNTLDGKKARALIAANSNFIKRPVLDTGKELHFGFKPAVYEKVFGG
jgi:arsenate reductase (glutaredoxin)